MKEEFKKINSQLGESLDSFFQKKFLCNNLING